MERNKTTVLIADDHAMVRQGFAALLSGEPTLQIVGQCGDGRELLNEVQRLVPDVVVLDISLPGLNGLDACRDIARHFKSTSVLMLTMHADEQFVVRAFQYGASGYLLKEAAGEELVQAVKSVACGQVYIGTGIPKGVLQRLGRQEADPYEQLTSRERQVLQMIVEGRTNRQIAHELKVSVKTIDTHRGHLMRKLGIHDQTNLVKYAIRRGIVPL